MFRVVCDTNTLVSGLLFSGNEHKLLCAARENRVRLFSSEPILSELADVLEKKFCLPLTERKNLLSAMRSLCEIVQPGVSLVFLVADPDDDKILECALAAKAHYIVSGDRHLLGLGEFRGIPVVGTRQLLSLLSP